MDLYEDVPSDGLVPISAVVARSVKERRLLHAYDTAAVTEETGIDTGDETLVQQQFAEEADINTIVRRFGLTQSLPADVERGVYGDFSGITDFESAVEMVDRARAGFMALPAELRDKFGNDPGRLISYASQLSDDQLDMEFNPPAAPVVAPDGTS